jgi:multidrug efflux pump subunit AcrB
MVVLGGIAVNNGIYIAESPKGAVRSRVRDKIRSLAATSLTTIAGCVPLLIFSGSDFSRSLAFFMLWGTLGSVLASLGLFPGVLKRLSSG